MIGHRGEPGGRLKGPYPNGTYLSTPHDIRSGQEKVNDWGGFFAK